MKKQMPPQKQNPRSCFAVMNDPDSSGRASMGDLVIHEGAVATIVKRSFPGSGEFPVFRAAVSSTTSRKSFAARRFRIAPLKFSLPETVWL